MYLPGRGGLQQHLNCFLCIAVAAVVLADARMTPRQPCTIEGMHDSATDACKISTKEGVYTIIIIAAWPRIIVTQQTLERTATGSEPKKDETNKIAASSSITSHRQCGFEKSRIK